MKTVGLIAAVTLAVLASPAAGVISTNKSLQLDIPTLQRLSVMDYETAAQQLKEMPPEPYIQYVLALGQIWDKKQNPRLTRLYLDLALSVARQNKMKDKEAEILFFYGLYESSNEKLQEALKHITASTMICEQAGMTNMLKECLSVKGSLEHQRGAYPDAIAAYERLLTLATGKDDELQKAHAIEETALLRYKMGQTADGEKKAKEALEIFERKQDDKGIADCLKLLGNIRAGSGSEEEAVKYYERAAEKYKAAQDVHGQGNCQFNTGLSYCRLKQYEKSVAAFQDAIASYTRSSSVTGVGMTNTELGNTYLKMGALAKAEGALLLARTLLTKSGCIARLAEADGHLARLRLAQGNKKEAVGHYKDAIEHYESVKMTDEAAEVRQWLSAIEAAEKPAGK